MSLKAATTPHRHPSLLPQDTINTCFLLGMPVACAKLEIEPMGYTGCRSAVSNENNIDCWGDFAFGPAGANLISAVGLMSTKNTHHHPDAPRQCDDHSVFRTLNARTNCRGELRPTVRSSLSPSARSQPCIWWRCGVVSAV